MSGYVVACLFGIVDLTPVQQAAWFDRCKFERSFMCYVPQLYWGAILSMAPMLFVSMTEHMGHMLVLYKLTKRDSFKDPGLNHTLAGDGTACMLLGSVGGPPVSSYGENIGGLLMTKGYSVYVLGGAGMLLFLSLSIGKLSALICSIPSPVIGGISSRLSGVMLLYGLRVLIDNKVDSDKKRNLMMLSTIFVIGIGKLCR